MATRRERGFTLMELVVAMGISVLLTVLVVEALVGLAKDRSSREMVVEVQGEARMGLAVLERNLRTASLGAGTGVIWFQDPRPASPTFNTRVNRPAVQIYDNVAGGGALLTPPAKPGTDALLVVEALGSAQARTAVVGNQIFPPTAPPLTLPVTNASQFTVNGFALFGEYGDAGWAPVTAINANVLTLQNTTVNLFRARDSTLPSGSLVRPARARLYYVDTNDQLVRLSLVAPVPPAAAADIVDREVLAMAFENLQIDCQTFANGAAAACGAPQADADATAALGASSSRIPVAAASTLRVVSVSAVIRSRSPVQEQQGDATPTIAGQQLNPSGFSRMGLPLNAGDAYVRRVYRIEVAVRNTSLGVL